MPRVITGDTWAHAIVQSSILGRRRRALLKHSKEYNNLSKTDFSSHLLEVVRNRKTLQEKSSIGKKKNALLCLVFETFFICCNALLRHEAHQVCLSPTPFNQSIESINNSIPYGINLQSKDKKQIRVDWYVLNCFGEKPNNPECFSMENPNMNFVSVLARTPRRAPARVNSASMDMQDMRNCYDSLLSAAPATTNNAYGVDLVTKHVVRVVMIESLELKTLLKGNHFG
ncbi:hypothetical protein Sjap_022161 [Stephania japonica]|uniref:Uncharacterized protein n=1 Tax=Stephania japonica TaxID=461633 RepID=A0AAP0ENS5_9MAGN